MEKVKRKKQQAVNKSFQGRDKSNKTEWLTAS